MSWLDPFTLWFKNGFQLPARRRVALGAGILAVDHPNEDQLEITAGQTAIQAAGVVQPIRAALNFVGFTVTDDSINERTNIARPSDFVSSIQNAGIGVTQRPTLNFIGFNVADDAANARTNITNPVIVKRQLTNAATNTTSLTDIPDLQFNIAAGELWIVQWFLHVSIAGAPNNGVRISGVWPAGMGLAEIHGTFTTLSTSLTAAAPGVTQTARTQTSATDLIFPNTPAGLLDGYVIVDGVFQSSTAAGLIKLRSAMAASIGGATTIDTFSYMRASRG